MTSFQILTLNATFSKADSPVLIGQEILVRFDLDISLPFFPCNGNYLMLITALLRLGSHTFAGHLPVHNRRDHFTQFFCLCPHC